MADKEHMPEIPNVICYEDLIEKESSDFEWPEFDENTASGLCYTSGTTETHVLYSHRSTVLHALIQCFYNAGSFSPKKKILPIVPLFMQTLGEYLTVPNKWYVACFSRCQPRWKKRLRFAGKVLC